MGMVRKVQAFSHFVQDNHSHSGRGVLRGLHYQLPHLRKVSWCG